MGIELMSEIETQGLREQIASDVREIKSDVRQINQAVMGDKSIGLNGLVDDMKEMKRQAKEREEKSSNRPAKAKNN